MITCICWIRRSRAIKVPDRPTPALQWTTIGLWSVETRSRKDLTNRMSVVGGSGTPKSGHVLKWKWRMIRLDSPYNEIKTNSSDENRHHKHSFHFLFLPYRHGTRKWTSLRSDFHSRWLPMHRQSNDYELLNHFKKIYPVFTWMSP